MRGLIVAAVLLGFGGLAQADDCPSTGDVPTCQDCAVSLTWSGGVATQMAISGSPRLPTQETGWRLDVTVPPVARVGSADAATGAFVASDKVRVVLYPANLEGQVKLAAAAPDTRLWVGFVKGTKDNKKTCQMGFRVKYSTVTAAVKP